MSNFQIRGCFFDLSGQNVYILASKASYCSYLVKYEVSSKQMGKQHTIFDFSPVQVSQVHEHATSKLVLAKNGQVAAIGTSDGFIKVYDVAANELLLSQKRHNMPVNCASFLGINDLTAP